MPPQSSQKNATARLKLAAATSNGQKISKVSLVVSQDFPCRVVFPHDAQRLSRKSKGSRSLSAQHRRALHSEPTPNWEAKLHAGHAKSVGYASQLGPKEAESTGWHLENMEVTELAEGMKAT